jgi:N-acetylneuraminic acid mutarotase
MQAKRILRGLAVLLVALLAFAPVATRAAPPAAGTWTTTGSLHQARGFQTATLLPNGLVPVAGGASDNGFLASVELYHPHTGSWATTGSMRAPRGQFTATLLRDGQVLAVGGGNNKAYVASAEIYNPQTGRWVRTSSMHEARVFHTATLLPDGRVLVAGGEGNVCPDGSSSGILASAELYDPRTGTWTMTGSMRQARARATATLLPSGQVLVAGGAGGCSNVAGANPLSSAELYNPQTGMWTMTGSMHTATCASAATLLHNGLVLVDGGFGIVSSGSSGWLTDAELYHPRTGTWTVTGSMHDRRGYQTGQTATLLGRGQVLVVGGCSDDGCSAVLASAELYNPSTGRWAWTGSMLEPRTVQTMTLLPNGQVLVAGGSRTNNLSNALTDAELYQP